MTAKNDTVSDTAQLIGNRLYGFLLLGIVACVLGCNQSPLSPLEFQMDMVELRLNENSDTPFTQDQLENLADVMTALFGSPDEPYVPNDPEMGLHDVVDLTNLKMAAGTVGSDQWGRPSGLFRRHCVHCHGVTGDGKGPTSAFLNPYPRDYRTGVFKFKSTGKGIRPTDQDLTKILVHGVAGTSMPSFALLPDDEREALLDYVRYLSIRGEVERSLIFELGDLDEGELLIDPNDQDDGMDIVKGVVSLVVNRWKQAGDSVGEIPARPDWRGDELHASIARGRELFNGAVANCVKCHGNAALGDGQTNDFDDWTKNGVVKLAEDLKRSKGQLAGVSDDQKDNLESYIQKVESALDGALEVRNIKPRNLRQGVYRGGRRPIDLYWRITNGIDGTPMPALKLLPPEDVWHLIDYVRSLPYESISRPQFETGSYQVDRHRPL